MRGRWDFLRKGAAIAVVLLSVTTGMLGLGLLVDEGRVWAIGLLAITPVGIWAATRITPEGGTSGYCDQNI